jgi:mitotic-spindle organizing protein 1
MNHINMVLNTNSQAIDYEDARQTLDALYELSTLMKCGVDRNTLSILVSMLEGGTKPEQLAAIVGEIKRRVDGN